MNWTKRRIGHSDLYVTPICLGTMNWGQQNSEKDAHEQLDFAIEEKRINFIDTAEIYPVPPEINKQGLTEIYLGTWLKKRQKRDDLIIASKVAASTIIKTRAISSPPRYNARNIRDALDGSLKRLNTDYIDLYQIHWPERSTNFFGVRGVIQKDREYSTPIEETLEVLTQLRKEGKIRYIGVSNENPYGIMKYLTTSKEKKLDKIVSIQNQYSLLNRTFEIGLSEIALNEDIGLLAYSVLNMGVLTGKYINGARPKGARFSISHRSYSRYNPDHAQPAIKAYIALANKYNIEPAQMAIAFAMNRGFTASVIIGATKIDQLRSDIEASGLVLIPELLSEIENLYLNYPDPTC